MSSSLLPRSLPILGGEHTRLRLMVVLVSIAGLSACEDVGSMSSCAAVDGGHADGELPVSPLCPGACDDDAARAVVYDAAGRPMYAGQALMVGACAGGGNACHSRNADPALRYGTPAGLDFDVAPLALDTNGLDAQALHDLIAVQSMIDGLRGDIFESVSGGSMPPGAVGAEVVNVTYGWVHDPAAPDTDTPLPSVGSPEGREILRNWLACGAPFVERWTSYELTTSCTSHADCPTENCVAGRCRPAGDVIPPITRPIEANWSSVYRVLLAPCSSCHAPDAAGVSIAGLDLSSADVAWTSLVNVPAHANDDALRAVCGGAGRMLVLPFDPDHSLLVNLTDGSAPPCGRRMARFVGRELDALRGWIASGACRADCALPATAMHATATCTDEVCGLVCETGFADTNLDRSDGCETTL